METIKLNVHSFIDLITNSSTEIYIDYSDSIIPCKEMINEMFKTLGVDKTCDDVFDIRLENANADRYEYDDDDYDPNAPWEEDECNPAYLLIKVKDEKYDSLAKLIKEFLESGKQKEFLS